MISPQGTEISRLTSQEEEEEEAISPQGTDISHLTSQEEEEKEVTMLPGFDSQKYKLCIHQI